MDSHVNTDVSNPSATIALRVYDKTNVEGLTIRDTTFSDFGTGVLVESGANVVDLIASGLHQETVDEPWKIPMSVLVRGGLNTPSHHLIYERHSFDAGERRDLIFPDIPPTALEDLWIRAVPVSPAAGEHGYRVDSIGTTGGDLRVSVVETGNDDGGEVKILGTVE
jgi:hypothetical protein